MQFLVQTIKYDLRSRLTVPQALLAKGFFCLPIRISCFIISSLSLITSIILLGGLIVTVAGTKLEELDGAQFNWIVSLLFCGVLIDMIASTLLFWGSLKQRKNLVIPYAVFHFVLIFLGFIAIGTGALKKTTWKNALISLSVQGISIYVWMIVVSYYQLISESTIAAEKLVQ